MQSKTANSLVLAQTVDDTCSTCRRTQVFSEVFLQHLTVSQIWASSHFMFLSTLVLVKLRIWGLLVPVHSCDTFVRDIPQAALPGWLIIQAKLLWWSTVFPHLFHVASLVGRPACYHGIDLMQTLWTQEGLHHRFKITEWPMKSFPTRRPLTSDGLELK